MKVSTLWLKDYVTLAPPLEGIADRLTMAGLEVKKIETVQAGREKDTVFEVEVTSNRPDWLSHVGIAREISAVLNLSLKMPEAEKTSGRPAAQGWKIDLKESEGCPYYSGVYIEGVQQVATPEFMRARLEACGIRPVNFLADVTNFVMMETGQPLHAFDADLISNKEIRIRRAKSEEKFVTLNGRELALSADDLLIADAEKGIALAGVMGGKNTEISERTRNVFLESAYFQPRWVRKTARKFSLSSDSSYRFERKVDPEGVDLARERAVSLIRQYASPRFISAPVKVGNSVLAPKTSIHFNLQEIVKRIGCEIKPSLVLSILTRLGLEVKKDSEEIWRVQIPTFRPDLADSIDLIEEIARIHGFDQIPEALPAKAPVTAVPNPLIDLQLKTQDFFAASGFFETVTFSLIAPSSLGVPGTSQGLPVHNPRNQDLTLMRPYFYPGLLNVIQRNVRQGFAGGGFFEVANLYTYSEEKKHLREEKSLGAVIFGNWKTKNWMDSERPGTFYDLKGSLEFFLSDYGFQDISFKKDGLPFLSPAVSEKIWVQGIEAGFVGEISSVLLKKADLEDKVYYAQLNLAVLSKLKYESIKKFREIPKYPSLSRDISIVVKDSTKAGFVQSEIMKQGNGLILKVEIFDLFTGGRIPKGFKNLAFRVIYQSAEKTLVSADIQKIHSEIAEKIASQFQARFQ